MSRFSSFGYSADAYTIYNRYFEYERVVSFVSVTDEGIYQVNQVPDNYAGAQLDIQCVNAVYMVNSRSEMVIFEFNVEPPMDKDRKSGGPTVRDGVTIREKTGESTVPVLQVTVPNVYLDARRKQIGAAAKALFRADLQATPSQPIT